MAGGIRLSTVGPASRGGVGGKEESWLAMVSLRLRPSRTILASRSSRTCGNREGVTVRGRGEGSVRVGGGREPDAKN